MKKKLCLIFVVFCLILIGGCDSADNSASDPAPSIGETLVPEVLPTSALSQREQDWLEDIEFLREKCKTKHMDPFYLCSEEEFDWKLNQLAAGVGELSDDDITLEIISIIAGLGDPHTYATPPQSFYDWMFPIEVQYFGNKLYLTAYMKDFEQFEPYLLHEIVAVNGVDITFLTEKANRLGNPFNIWFSRVCFPDYFFFPAFFDWAGCDYKLGYTFQILNDNGEVKSVKVPVVSSDESKMGSWTYPEAWDALLYLKDGNWAEYLDGENGGCVYVSLAELMDKYSVKRLVQNTSELLETHPTCGKLVVDLRNTPGGNAKFVECFQENAQLLEVEHTYVLTGGTTASAAMTFITYFKDEMGAVTVGEPTGQFTSMFHMQTSLDKPTILPHSQISVMLSNAWWDAAKNMPELGVLPVFEEYYDENGKLYEWESTILPDVFVYQNIEDIRQGKDSIIKWVLEQ